MKKSEIRHIYKERRTQLTATQVAKMDDLMLIQFLKLPFDIPSIIMTYAPMEQLKEFDPLMITDYCYFKNPEHQLLYPLIKSIDLIDKMIAILVNDDTEFEKSGMGFFAPSTGEEIHPRDIDLIIVPLLAFDKMGYRVGYGKGFYDHFLKKCRKDAIKIGFSYFEPIEAIEDKNEFDIPMDFCITHNEIHIF